MLAQLRLMLFVGVLLQGCSGFVEEDIQCRHPIEDGTRISVDSSKICDGALDCADGLDESGDLCGSVLSFEVGFSDSSNQSVTLWWATLDGSVERQMPDGSFVTWKSASGSFTVKLDDSEQPIYEVEGLDPGTNYTFFVRPYVNSENSTRGYVIGKAASISGTTRVADPQNVTLNTIHSGAGMIGVLAWNALGHVDSFEVRVLESLGHCEDCYNWLSPLEAITVESTNVEDRTYSVVAVSSSSKTAYHVSSCTYGSCGSDVVLYGGVRPEPAPRVTYVAGLSRTSLELRWKVEGEEVQWDDRFIISCCAEGSASCRVIHSKRRSLTVGHLLPGTWYNIEVRIPLGEHGRGTALSRPGNARVSTWTIVPQGLEISERAIAAEVDAVVLGWTIHNSTLEYVQFLVDQGQWQNCSESHHCSLTTFQPRSEDLFVRRGTLRFSNLLPDTHYTFLVRACNVNGCGPHRNVSSTTMMTVPSPPVNVRGTIFGNGTALILWEPPRQPGGPTHGYEITWRCGEEGEMAARVTSTAFLATGITQGEDCSWSVVAYHVTPEGRLLLGEPGAFACQQCQPGQNGATLSTSPLAEAVEWRRV